MSLARFHEAQAARDGGFATALAELQAGRKRSHWIWYIFPQLAGLGRSGPATFYALRDAEEAAAYLRDPTLRSRLQEITSVVAGQLAAGAKLSELMGSEIDALKLVSSLTLFGAVARKLQPAGTFELLATECERALADAGRQGYARCAHTLRQIDTGA